MRIVRSSAAGVVGALAAAVLLTAGPAAAAGTSTTVLSGATPFADCPPDSSQYSAGSETEPWVATDPTDPDNLAVVWQQDRHAWGSSRGIMLSTSHDGGRQWSTRPLPGFAPCTDVIGRVTNPYASFGSDGTLYASVTMIGTRSSVWVTKSADAGDTWSAPVALVDDDRTVIHDKQATTVDPRNPGRVYAVWNRRTLAEDKHDLLLATSTDGGTTWAPARSIYRPATTAGTVGSQVLVQRDGSLLIVFFESDHPIGGAPTPPLPEQIKAIRSTDGGATWSAPVVIADHKVNVPVLPGTTKQLIAPGMVPDVALDPVTGTVYAVWGDASLGTGGSAVALSASYDRGRTWTTPRKVNGTPDTALGGTGQAFLPQVDVHPNGTVAVSYQDFRDDTADVTSTLTSSWIATCRSWSCATSPSGWSERRLSAPVAGIEGVSPSFGGPFIGTYSGLAHDDDSFLAVQVEPTGVPTDPQNVRFTKVPLC
ncbi:sialidase family protein [Streptomyces hydrogenans]|uniref:sialidase family protein n=1 Tax=Streptomyces hydrogenans TaxID=1873719 RepID=UPI0035D607FA